MRTLKAIFFAIAFLLSFSCEEKEIQSNKFPLYESFLDIPGITSFEIKAIDALRERNISFVYGALLGTDTFYGQNNEIKGYTALFCKHLSNLFGIEFKPAIYDWSDLITGLASGSIDFTGELTASDERRKTYYMTDAISERSVNYFYLKNAMPFSQIATQRPLKFGFLNGAVTLDLVSSLSQEKFEPFIVADHAEAYNALKSGEIDAFLDESNVEAIFDVYEDIVSEEILPLIYSTVSLATRKQELAPVISIVQKMLRKGYNVHSVEMQKQGWQDYVKSKLQRQFTKEEREYLSKNPVVPFAVELDNYPISFHNKHENVLQGVIPDVLREIETLTGLSFEMFDSKKATSGPELWSKTALMKDKHALISKLEYPDIGTSEILYKRVGLVKGSVHTELFKFWFPNHPKITEFENATKAFKALELENIDLLMASQNKLLLMTNYMEQPGYKVNILFDHPYELHLGFNKGEHILLSIVEKTLQQIETERIAERWEHKIYDYRVKFAETQFLWFIGSSVLLFCIIILLFVLYEKNRSEGKRLEILVQKRASEIEEQRKMLEYMSLTDQLTKLPNRRNFDMRLDLEWRNAVRSKHAISLLMLDIDNFKDYNDKYGHQKGDEILCIISKIISQTLKRSIDFVARWGGEEFAILLSFTDAEGAIKVAELIRANIENTDIPIAGGPAATLTVSIGVHTQIPKQSSSIDSFISVADKELYRAKETGKNRVCHA